MAIVGRDLDRTIQHPRNDAPARGCEGRGKGERIEKRMARRTKNSRDKVGFNQSKSHLGLLSQEGLALSLAELAEGLPLQRVLFPARMDGRATRGTSHFHPFAEVKCLPRRFRSNSLSVSLRMNELCT